jgi:hypothetical protein
MVKLMFTASADDRGAVQALARELDAVREDGEFTYNSVHYCSV